VSGVSAPLNSRR